jgi:hypothetical protein
MATYRYRPKIRQADDPAAHAKSIPANRFLEYMMDSRLLCRESANPLAAYS